MKTVFQSPPAYTFGTRHKNYGLDNTPGIIAFRFCLKIVLLFLLAPNAYGLPGMLGKTVQSVKKQAPMYTLTGRSKHGGFDEDLQRTPGPGKY
jgi:hypothetical protein